MSSLGSSTRFGELPPQRGWYPLQAAALSLLMLYVVRTFRTFGLAIYESVYLIWFEGSMTSPDISHY